MPFAKKHIPWNKERKMSAEEKAASGLRPFSKGNIPHNKGVPMSAEEKTRLTPFFKGHVPWNKDKPYPMAEVTKRKISQTMIERKINQGRPLSTEQKLQISKTLTGRRQSDASVEKRVAKNAGQRRNRQQRDALAIGRHLASRIQKLRKEFANVLPMPPLITPEAVVERIRAGETITAIARYFGCNRPMVRKMRNRWMDEQR